MDMESKQVAEALESIINHLMALKRSIESDHPQMPDHAIEKQKKGICLFCNLPLGDSVVVSSDHERCYRKIMRAIKKGETTMNEAIAAGLVGPPKSGGRPKTTEVIDRLKSVESDVKEAAKAFKKRKDK